MINDGEEFSAIQPSILTYDDGRMQVLCRTRQGVIAQSWSEDQGKTWSKMSATRLPNPNSGTDAVTLRDGRQLLVYNHTTRRGPFPSGRNMLNVALSNDGQVVLEDMSKGQHRISLRPDTIADAMVLGTVGAGKQLYRLVVFCIS